MVMNSSGVVCSLPPKPPPTSGAITRIFDSGTPSTAASRNRRMCGIWVADHMRDLLAGRVDDDRARLHEGRDQPLLAVLALDDDAVGAGLRDGLVDVAAGARPRPSRAARTRDLLVPRSGCASTLSSAASLRSSAAGSSSYSTSTSSAASRASAAERATTTATISPAKATRSTAHRRVVGRHLVRRDRPGVVQRALPVGDVLAGEHGDDVGRGLARRSVSMLMIRACAKGLRTMAMCSIPAA